MRKDARIYIVGHKPVEYGIWDNDLYQPIQVGTNEDFCNVRDNTGDNIVGTSYMPRTQRCIGSGKTDRKI